MTRAFRETDTPRPARSALGLATALAVSTLTIAPALAADITMMVAHDMPETSPHHLATVRFKDLLAERTEGRIDVQIFPNSLLGASIQVTEQVQAGAIQAAVLPTAWIAPIAPELTVLDLPFLFPSRAVAHAVIDGPVGAQILAPLGRVGLTGLGYWESGFKQFTGNFPIRTPEDFSGHKIRAMPSQVIQEQFRAFGASPTQIAFSELFNALQQGVVDGQENPINSITAAKLYEVQPYITLSDHGYLGYVFFVNSAFFDGLSAEDQTAMRASVAEARDYERQLIEQNEATQLETFKAAGVTIIPLTDAERAAFRAAAQPVYAWYRAQNGDTALDDLEAAISAQESD
ncbi:MAG: TRAP transporter substrate-binding protein [Qingshengfaniella sp.]